MAKRAVAQKTTGQATTGSDADFDDPPPASSPNADDKSPVSLTALMSKRAEYTRFQIWIVGDTPLITHAWSEKAKREMLAKQVKATQLARDKRDPQEDFINSLYAMDEDKAIYGFPATGIKDCILSVAHKDRGIPRTTARSALWIAANMYRTRPALAAAICDMPLIRIYGSKPEMREDMVRIGAGLNKTATLAYRSQFTHWAMKIRGRFNTTLMPVEALQFLIAESGTATGIGEWRNERNGMFGSFHIASASETEQWERFSIGAGDLPVSSSYNDFDDEEWPEAAE